MSLCLARVPASPPSRGNTLMPTEALSACTSSAMASGLANVVTMRGAIAATCVSPSQGSRKTINSSPPKRTTWSVGRNSADSRCAAARNSRSGTAWPCESLTRLNSSRSMNSMANSGVSRVQGASIGMGRRTQRAIAIDNADCHVGPVGKHAVALEALDQGWVVRVFPAVLEPHRHLVHLADRALQVLFIRLGVGVGILGDGGVRPRPLGVRAGDGHRPDACAGQQRPGRSAQHARAAVQQRRDGQPGTSLQSEGQRFFSKYGGPKSCSRSK
jgi:hypothetical protein